jgi:hypothetical protein
MEEKVPGIWWKWLVAASGFVVLFGFVLLFFGDDLFLDPPLDALASEDRAFQSWVYGVLGAVMVGWGILLLYVAYVPFRRGERWAWHSLFLALVVWYVLDTGASLYHGVYLNAAFNTGFLVIFGIPLLASARRFPKGR